MREGLRLVDSDRHVLEPIGMWKEYLPPGYRDGAPSYEAQVPQESLEQRIARLGPKGLLPPMPMMMLDGQPVLARFSERARVEVAWSLSQRHADASAGSTAQHHLRSMERTGVDMAFFFPTMASFLLRIDGMHPDRA